MDFATFIGLIGAFALVFGSMALNDITIYLNLPSFLIVVLGSLFIVMMKFGMRQFFASFRITFNAFFYRLDQPQKLIDEIAQLSDVSRKGGLLALEEMSPNNLFLSRSLELLIDGYEENTLIDLLNTEKEQTLHRHREGSSFFLAMGDVAPALGMIGTLIGLVQMLVNMDDPQSIGPSMAIALLTTMYGSIMANMLAIPIADKLSLRSQQENVNNEIIIDGVIGMLKGLNPRVIQRRLNVYLSSKYRKMEE